MYTTPVKNVNYLSRFNVSPVDEYSSTREKIQLSTRVQFSLLVSTLVPTDAVDGIVSVYAWDFCIEVLVFKI